MEQHTVWYSLPNGHGVQGTNILPGQLYSFFHVLMDSSKQLTQLGVKLYHVAIPCLQDLTNFPKMICEGWPLLRCD